MTKWMNELAVHKVMNIAHDVHNIIIRLYVLLKFHHVSYYVFVIVVEEGSVLNSFSTKMYVAS